MHDGDRLLADLAAAQERGDLFLVRLRRGAAVGQLCLALDERLRKLGAARPAAAAAVGFGEQLFHPVDALVPADGKEMGADDEQRPEYEGEGEHDAARRKDRNDLFMTHLTPPGCPKSPQTRAP